MHNKNVQSRVVNVWGLALILVFTFGCNGDKKNETETILIAQGKEVFRFDTFGDEQLWTEQLKLHQVIESAVSPQTALAVGLKVDADVLPDGILSQVDLTDPATTLALLKLNAVVGLQGEIENVAGKDRLKSIGVTCALCHSTVDDSVAPGIGKRKDGWPNRDLNVGLILSLSPAMQDPAQQEVLLSWGAGKYDAYWNHDGINDPTVIPPAYGLKGIELETFTGEGEVSYWNAYVAVTQMGAQGNFTDADMGINITHSPDLLTAKLPALKAYQLSLTSPPPPAASFEQAAAERGKLVFNGTGRCGQCHSGDLFTDANMTLHDPIEVGTDPILASRGKTGQYRTTPLAGMWQHPPYFHNGSASTIDEVIEHYDRHMVLGLTEDDKSDLRNYLLSL